MKKVKSCIKHCLLGIVNIVFSFIFTSTIVLPFEKFGLINERETILASIVSAIILFVAVLIIKSVCAKMIVYSRGVIWFQKHKANFILICFMLMFLSVSLKNTIVYTKSDLKDIISLQWTIFAITITMFIVWTSIILKYLKETEPKLTENKTDEMEFVYKIRKRNFYSEIIKRTTSLVFVIINALVLILSTSMVYIINEEVTLLAQIAVIFSFYVTVNSFSQILIEITIPYFDETIGMLINNDVSAQEINQSQNKVLLKVVKDVIVKRVENNDSLTMEEKKEKINTTYEDIKQKLAKLNKEKPSETTNTIKKKNK